MNWLTLLPIFMKLAGLASQIRAVYDSSTSNTMGKIAAVISKTDTVSALSDIGAQLFPKLAPTIHAAAAALVVAHPNATAWLQSALNVVNNAGLVEDGVYGPKTRAAVEAFQSKLGLKVTGFAADAENSALMAALAKLG